VDEEDIIDIIKEDEEAGNEEEDRDMHRAGQPKTQGPDEQVVHAVSE